MVGDLEQVVDGVLAAKRAAGEQDWEAAGYGRWRASSLGACPRQQTLARLGVPASKVFDAKTLRIFALGDMLHDWLFDQWEAAGIVVAREVRYEDPVLGVVGHADGILVADDAYTIGVEVKSANSSTMRSVVDRGPKVEHAMQVGCYWLMSDGKEYATTRPDRWGLVYIGKDYAGMLQYEAAPEWRKAAADTLALLNRHWDDRSLPVCTCTTAYGGTGPFYCGYLDRDEDIKLVAALSSASSADKKKAAPRVQCCARSAEGIAVAVALRDSWDAGKPGGDDFEALGLTDTWTDAPKDRQP